jgi:hypothetical protein
MTKKKFHKLPIDILNESTKKQLVAYIDWLQDMILTQGNLLEHQKQLIAFQVGLMPPAFGSVVKLSTQGNEELRKDIGKMVEEQDG